MKYFDYNLIVALTSILALIISILCYYDNRKARIEQGRAYISVELMRNNSKLYLVLSNIGNTYAYDMEISISKPFVNLFQDLKTIRPECVYRYCLLDNVKMSDYPTSIEVMVSYHDSYSSKIAKKKKFTFNLLDCSKYDIIYNQDFSCYDISKSFD